MTFDSAFQSALRAQGDLSDDEIKRAEFVARNVAVAMLEEAAKIAEAFCVCDSLEDQEETNWVLRNRAQRIRAIIQRVQRVRGE